MRRIDIAMESSLTSGNGLVPDEIIDALELYTALAWDNFNMSIETKSEGDSVHQ